jgi:hypothetical protein
VLDLTERKRAEAEARESERRYRETQTQLAHANRVATMGQLTASIAHEVNQPIAAALTNAQAALRWLGAEPPNMDEARPAASGSNRVSADRVSPTNIKPARRTDRRDINQSHKGPQLRRTVAPDSQPRTNERSTHRNVPGLTAEALCRGEGRGCPCRSMPARKAEGADRACTCRTYTGSFTLTFRHGRHGHRPERQQLRARATYPVRRGPGGAAATRTKFSRRLRHLAFKCWLSERSAASELEPSRRSVLSLAGQVILRPILRLAAVCCESRQLYRTRR